MLLEDASKSLRSWLLTIWVISVTNVHSSVQKAFPHISDVQFGYSSASRGLGSVHYTTLGSKFLSNTVLFARTPLITWSHQLWEDEDLCVHLLKTQPSLDSTIHLNNNCTSSANKHPPCPASLWVMREGKAITPIQKVWGQLWSLLFLVFDGCGITGCGIPSSWPSSDSYN